MKKNLFIILTAVMVVGFVANVVAMKKEGPGDYQYFPKNSISDKEVTSSNKQQAIVQTIVQIIEEEKISPDQKKEDDEKHAALSDYQKYPLGSDRPGDPLHYPKG